MSKRMILHGLPESVDGRPINEVIADLYRIDFTYDEAKRHLNLIGHSVADVPKAQPHPPHEAIDFRPFHEDSPFLDGFLVRCTETPYEAVVAAVTIGSTERFVESLKPLPGLEASTTIRGLKRYLLSGKGRPSFFEEDAEAIITNKLGVAAIEAIQFTYNAPLVRAEAIKATGGAAGYAADKYIAHIEEALEW